MQAADTVTVKDGFGDVTEKLHSVDLSADNHVTESEDHYGIDGGENEEEGEQSDDENDDDDDDGDGGGWITPSNLKQVQMQATGDCGPSADVKVGCVTTDFAMQVLTFCYILITHTQIF